MYKDKRVLGIITARGGSKGLPGKNVMEIAGKPLVQWSVEQGLACEVFDRFIISTDDQIIADVARNAGCEIPFLRPDHLASDVASSIDVLLHAINWLEEQGDHFDYVVLLEPTSPLRAPNDIKNALELLYSNASVAHSVVSISESKSAHPDFTVKIKDNGILTPFFDAFNSKRRQDLEAAYFFDGTVYVSTIDGLRKHRGFYHDKTIGFPVEAWQAYEIDDYIDFVVVEAVLKARLEKRL